MSVWLRRLRKLLTGLILSLGVLALLLRLATPLLDGARQPLSEWLSQQLGAQVQVGRLNASWYGLGPRIRLSDVTIGGGRRPLRIQRTDLDLAPSGLFSGNPLNMLRLTITGLHLSLLRNRDGHIEVQGLPLADAAPGHGPLPLPRRLRLRKLSLDWHDLRAGGKQLKLPDISVQLEHDGATLKVRASLRSRFGNARFAADVRGNLSGDHWSGSSYLQLHGIDLQPLFSAYLPPEYRMRGGKLQGRLWQRWEDARPVHAQGQLLLSDLTFGSAMQPSQQVTLAQLGGRFRFQRQTSGDWHLLVEHLQVQAAGQPTWPVGELAVRRHTGPDGGQIEGAVEQLRIGVLARLLAIRPPDPAWQQPITILAPHGVLRNLRFRIDPADLANWALSSDFSQLGWHPWKGVPGTDGLSGSIAATPHLANVRLDTRDLSLDAPRLFRTPVSAHHLHGTLYWQQDSHNWSLQTDQLTLDSADFSSRLQMRLSRSGAAPVDLRLLGELRNGNVAATSRYLPAHIMGRELVDWLDSSLSNGRIQQATALVDGPLRDFPFDQRRDGTFQVIAYVRDAALHYQRGWPPLAHVDARLDFHQNSLDIDLLKGRIYDSPIEQARASIASLNPTSPLRLQGQLSGPLADPLRLLGEPALRDDFGHIARALKVTGDSQLALKFQVPLVHGRGQYQLDGDLRFLGDGMRLPKWHLGLDDIRGDLKIGLHALSARDIQARGLGAPLRVDVTPIADGGTRVSARGRLGRAAIARQLPTLPLRRVSGAADFQVAVEVPGLHAPAGTPTRVKVSSQLRGMRVDLPAPLGKAAGQSRALEVEVPLGSEIAPVRVDYGKLHALFSSDGRRGDIRYASGTPLLSKQAGYHLQARLERLDLTPWAALAGDLDNNKAAVADWQAAIEVHALLYQGLRLDNASLAIQGDPQWVSGSIRSTQINGRFDYPRAGRQPLQISLSRAHLRFPPNGKGKTQTPARSARPTPDPRSLPAVQLSVDDLYLNAAKLGRLTLHSRPVANGLTIPRLAIDGPSGSLLASGSWTGKGRQAETRLHGSFNIPALGKLLKSLGYPQNVVGAPTHGRFDLHWAGDPAQLSLAGLQGDASVQLGEGRLAEVDPGITRVIGLLSLDALKRRLQLDFGDLIKKGYSFDSIKGSFRFAHGRAFTDDLHIAGPSGRIESGGYIGLVQHDFNQVVVVTPNLDTTLPLISTLAGGPVAGVATLVAQKLFSKQVERMYRFIYSVTGSWEQPKINALAGGGALSRIVNTVTGEKPEAQTPEQKKLLRSDLGGPDLLQRLLKALPNPPPPASDQEAPKTRLR